MTSQNSTPIKRFRESIDFCHGSVTSLLNDIADSELLRFFECLESSERIFVYGSGRSGLTSRAFAIRLAHLGFQSFVIGDTICPPIHEKDLVVIVSGSGTTMPSLMTASIADEIGAMVVAVTAHPLSPLCQHADIIIKFSIKDSDKRALLAPLGSLFEMACWVLFDGVIAELMVRKNESETSMRNRHATLQ